MKRREPIPPLAGSPASDTARTSPQYNKSISTLYVPHAQRVTSTLFLQDFMEEFPFADLVTAAPSPRITHLPVFLDRDAGDFGTIHGHISRQNGQQSAFDGEQEAVIVFRGPNRYISPAWYRTSPAVPTWNYAAVHATGRLSPVTDPTALHAMVARLTATFEAREGGTGYEISALPPDYVAGMLSGIVGFEMRIERLEGRFKFGQERPEADRQGILDHLRTASKERTLCDLTEAFYQRKA
ncbi:MAG: FMN-binding negative transcriptional regulator [Acidobacteriota bacterium]|nr:FMN-binding negative transcriptional regulator [Acidobacteriota bacterium]